MNRPTRKPGRVREHISRIVLITKGDPIILNELPLDSHGSKVLTDRTDLADLTQFTQKIEPQ